MNKQRCERCRAIAGEMGAFDRSGVWHSEQAVHDMNASYGAQLFGNFPVCHRTVLRSQHCQQCWPKAFPEQAAKRKEQAKNRARTIKRIALETKAQNIGQQMMDFGQ
jgi:hypothetical protein